MEHEKKKKISDNYDKYYKLLLVIPMALLLFTFIYLFMFYQQNHDFIKKDISLTGGTSIQVNSHTDITTLKTYLDKNLKDYSIRTVSDIVTGEQVAFIVDTKASPEEAKPIIEKYLGYSLDSKNSSIEFTGSTIGGGFYLQLVLAIIFSFTFMATVIFIIFSDKRNLKIIAIILALITPSLFFMFRIISINQAFILSGVTLLVLLYLSFRYNIPGLAVITSAFADIIMTLAVVNLLGMEVSTAGIVAFLMLIGYSVDTDILLTTRVLKRRGEHINDRIWGAFKTGMTMTLAALAVVIVGLIITAPFSNVLDQIFTVLLIGLLFDILNTWITNASMIKWYMEARKLE